MTGFIDLAVVKQCWCEWKFSRKQLLDYFVNRNDDCRNKLNWIIGRSLSRFNKTFGYFYQRYKIECVEVL